MKTEIADFCRDYLQVLNPLYGTLQSALECVESESCAELLRPAVTGLVDVRHRLKTLLDKVEGQEAFLLIFGPLKSGKSTLMNALSGVYVSEVTSLPAYPCLVFVRHGETQQFTMTRYNGRKELFKDSMIVQTVIREAHTHLAARIREVENSDAVFDPSTHYPEALRRVDIQLAAPHLRESGTVLVDTPGLYSRMKFGYDLLTREFRDSAACAIFVVKTDNLFLDHVFAEFNDLLGLFSRIFLVVNIDTNKKDLRPDGSLQPSLESRAPEKLIEAFESLAMSTPLRQAAAEGRLRIYPIDLLTAAARRLKGESGPVKNGFAPELPVSLPSDPASAKPAPWTEADSKGSEDEAQRAFYYEAEKPGSAAPAQPPGGAKEEARSAREAGPFDVFIRDLTDYLNSSDYWMEFMGDSLRQGRSLCLEVRQQSRTVGMSELIREKELLQRKLSGVEADLQTVEGVARLDWAAAFRRTLNDNEKQTAEMAELIQHVLATQQLRVLDNWFETNDSLLALAENFWNPRFCEAADQIARETRERIRALVSTPLGGAELTPDQIRAMDRIGLDLAPLRATAVASFETAGASTFCGIRLDAKQVPVRRGLLDWILFRNEATVRDRLFGPPERPARPVSSEAKRRRLRADGRLALRAALEQHIDRVFPDLARQCGNAVLQAYLDAFFHNISSALEQLGQRLVEKKSEIARQLRATIHVTESLGNLDFQAADAARAIEGRMNRFTHQTVK